jgi:arginine N-succinyltransferase
MFIMRNVAQDDLEDLFELSGKVLFINLPHDKRIIQEKITKSLKSFINPNKDLSENYYIFVLEDILKKKVIGVSMIHAQHGTELEPHFFLRVGHENKYSSTINTGFVHGTLKLGLETNGPTEIGGLVLHPDYRGNIHKLGKQISFVRFLYMAFNQDRFKEIIHSELMPPLDQNGHSPLWEAIGRRFMNMEYNEADKLSRSNKEFILSLFPNDNIYMTLLPMEARNSIGKVGRDTAPVKKMLEGIGFQYMNEVDPFDGGPHYRSKLNNIKPIRNKKSLKFNKDFHFDESTAGNYLVSFKKEDFQFYSFKTQASINDTSITFPKEIIESFKIKESDIIEIIPF